MNKTTRLVPANPGHVVRLVGGTLAALLWAGSAIAQPNPDLTLIEDTFTAADGTGIEGRAPQPVNEPGGTWARHNAYWASSIQGNAFQMGPDNGWTLPLESSGTYARPSKLRLSADLMVNNMDNGSGNGGGVGLGFNSILGGGGNPHGSVTALRLDQSGTLTFRRGEGGGLGDLASVPWSGPAFDPARFYHLSYEVDTLSGNISNIQVTGGAGDSTADYSGLATAAAGYFMGDLTTYAYIWGNSGSGGSTGYVDNFKVERAGAALPPVITLTTPAAATPDASISASASLIDGDGASAVQFYIRTLPGGSFATAGAPVTAPPYQVNLGSKPLGSYEIYATATDATTTVPSAARVVTVQASSGLINVDFNTSNTSNNANMVGTYAGAGVLGAPGAQTWNGVTLIYERVNQSGIALVDSANALTSYTIDVEGNRPCWDGEHGSHPLLGDWMGYNAWGSEPRITVHGLAAGSYNLAFYGGGLNDYWNIGSSVPWNFTGGDSVNTDVIDGYSYSDTSFVAGRNYVIKPITLLTAGDLIIRLYGTGQQKKTAGFQIEAVAANTAPVVTTTRPFDGQQVSTESVVTAKADFHYGTAPFTVKFFVDGSQVGGDVTAPPYQMNLGSLAIGSHQIHTKVIDSSTGGGPFTVNSAINTFTVADPAITVDKQYTFNAGPEADLATVYQSGEEAPVYGGGQVTLPSRTYLKGSGLFSRSPVNCGLELIMTQPEDSTANRFAVSTGPAFQIYWEGQNRQAGRDDYWGEFAQTYGVSANTEYRLAMVVTQSPGDPTVLESFYINGVFKGSRSEPADAGTLNNPMTDLWVGAWNWNSTGDGNPLAVKVNEVRVFHFAPDMFSPSLLLTGPTGGVTPPPTYASWAGDNGIAGQPADGDSDNDGVPNAVEMVVGGLPATRMDAGLLPGLALVTNPGGVPAGDYLEFTYRRTDLSVTAGVTAACQYTTDPGLPWTTAQDGVGGVKVVVTNPYAPYGTATARVQVYVPRAGNAKLFGRLQATVP